MTESARRRWRALPLQATSSTYCGDGLDMTKLEYRTRAAVETHETYHTKT